MDHKDLDGMNPIKEKGLDPQKGPGRNTVSTVAPLCTFLRIENRENTKRHLFCSGECILESKT